MTVYDAETGWKNGYRQNRFCVLAREIDVEDQGVLVAETCGLKRQAFGFKDGKMRKIHKQ